MNPTTFKLSQAAFAATLLITLPALAQSTLTDTMTVTAQVVDACSNLTANDIDFGSAPASDATDDQPATISVTCNTGTPYTVELNYGVNSAGTTVRKVVDGDLGESMNYVVYQPAAGGAAATAAEWGTNSAQANSGYTGTGSGTPQSLTATGRLSRTAGTSAGSYTDLITVTLTY